MTFRASRLFGFFGRYWSERRGIAAVEFAMILPFMALVYLGGFEVMEEIAAERQVELTASTVANIVTQYSSISQTQTMPGILAAATTVLTPFSSANAVTTVTCIYVNASGQAKVLWSQASSGSGRANGTITLPSALDVDNTTVILGETSYSYKPLIDYMGIGTKTLYSSIYMLPRQPPSSTAATTCGITLAS
jgi:Flp pilus assembly protein TadG